MVISKSYKKKLGYNLKSFQNLTVGKERSFCSKIKAEAYPLDSAIHRLAHVTTSG